MIIMDQEQLLNDINQAYDEQALQALCFRLGIDYESLEGNDNPGRARGLVRHLRQRGRLAELVRAVVQDNPVLADRYQVYLNRETDEASLIWLDELRDEQDAPADTGLTWRWPTPNQPAHNPVPDHGAAPTPVTTTQGLQTTLDWPEMSEQDSPDPNMSGEGVVEAQNPPIDLPAQKPVTKPAETKRTKNPYTPGVPVAGLHMFFGRQAELALLRQGILQGGHSTITGLPHTGKTSLLYALLRQGFPAENRLLLSRIDLGDGRYQTPAGFLNAIWQQWWRQIRPDISPVLRDIERFATAAGKLHSAGFQPVVCLDGLEQLVLRPEEFNDELFEVWRELAKAKKMLIVATSERPLADLFRQANMATKFYTLFQQLDLGLLDEQAARDLLTIPAQQRGLKIPAGAASHLLQLCGPHPLYLQIAGKHLFDGLAVQSYSWAEVKARFTQAADPYWQALWRSLSPLAQEYFPLKEVIPSTTLATRQYRLLAAKGVVIQEGERFRPFSEGFAFWVRGNR
jgi:hypothetical protein